MVVSCQPLGVDRVYSTEEVLIRRRRLEGRTQLELTRRVC